LKAGAEAEIDALHEPVRPEVVDAIRASGVTTWRI
jgi:L-rhamnose mutarotase